MTMGARDQVGADWPISLLVSSGGKGTATTPGGFEGASAIDGAGRPHLQCSVAIFDVQSVDTGHFLGLKSARD